MELFGARQNGGKISHFRIAEATSFHRPNRCAPKISKTIPRLKVQNVRKNRLAAAGISRCRLINVAPTSLESPLARVQLAPPLTLPAQVPGGLVVFVVSIGVVFGVATAGAPVVTSVLPLITRTGARDGRLSAAARLCHHPLPSSSCAPRRAVAVAVPVRPAKIRDPVPVRAQPPSRISGSKRCCAGWEARLLSRVLCSDLWDNGPGDARAWGAVNLTKRVRRRRCGRPRRGARWQLTSAGSARFDTAAGRTAATAGRANGASAENDTDRCRVDFARAERPLNFSKLFCPGF